MCGLETLLGLIMAPVYVVLGFLWMLAMGLSVGIGKIGLFMFGKNRKNLSEKKLMMVAGISSAVVIEAVAILLFKLTDWVHNPETVGYVPPGPRLLVITLLGLVPWFFVAWGTYGYFKPKESP